MKKKDTKTGSKEIEKKRKKIKEREGERERKRKEERKTVEILRKKKLIRKN